jgi:hypothetical protein
MLNQRAGIETVHVPYRSGAQAVTDLISGKVDAMFHHFLAFGPHIREGAIRAIVVTSDRRIEGLPDVPTMVEAGLPGFVVVAWWGLYAPAGTPAPIVARLNAAVNRFLADPEAQASLRTQGVDPVGGSAERLATLARGHPGGRHPSGLTGAGRCAHRAAGPGAARAEEDGMRDLDGFAITAAVLEQIAGTPDPRLKRLLESAPRRLHDFARGVELTLEEWLAGLAFLTAVGRAGVATAGVHPALRHARPAVAGPVPIRCGWRSSPRRRDRPLNDAGCRRPYLQAERVPGERSR